MRRYLIPSLMLIVTLRVLSPASAQMPIPLKTDHQIKPFWTTNCDAKALVCEATHDQVHSLSRPNKVFFRVTFRIERTRTGKRISVKALIANTTPRLINSNFVVRADHHKLALVPIRPAFCIPPTCETEFYPLLPERAEMPLRTSESFWFTFHTDNGLRRFEIKTSGMNELFVAWENLVKAQSK